MLGKKLSTVPTGVVPSGSLVQLSTEDIIPSRNNPRHLFDIPQLEALRKNISEHGVLVPITVYRPKGQQKYSILDGERRYRCCIELEEQGKQLTIPANVVEPPTKIAGLLYMFSIHNFREQWELMPTALGLKTVMDALGETDNEALCKLTGLSQPQVERCKKLLDVSEKYQQLSLDPNPETRIPSNFWIELHPVLNLATERLPKLTKELGRDGIIDALLEKYRAGQIRSVIHFRRIMEAYDVAENNRGAVLERLEKYVRKVDYETREAFDEFVVDNRRIQGAVDACSQFLKDINRLKVDYSLDRRELRDALKKVRDYADKLIAKLEGSDAPKTKE
ncbi:MAG: ParB N-terminal domain-containing protein [Verrucomicrobia bacterium]|nr:ParB N-terminal domain-containing protein [Verrucomicrobiota bacterium]